MRLQPTFTGAIDRLMIVHEKSLVSVMSPLVWHYGFNGNPKIIGCSD